MRKGEKRPDLQRARIGQCIKCGGTYRAIGDYHGKKIREQKYCSKKCWSMRNLPLKKNCLICNVEFLTYGKERISKIYCSIKCVGIAFQDRTEEKCPAWKGDDVKYSGLHKFIASRLGKPKECWKCHRIIENSKMIHWANKSGEYKRDLDDWLRLCYWCHRKYDGIPVFDTNSVLFKQ